MDKNKTMIDATLKTPNNLRRVIKDIYMSNCVIYKGALGYLIARKTINHPARCLFISLCEQYEFDITHLENSESYLESV